MTWVGFLHWKTHTYVACANYSSYWWRYKKCCIHHIAYTYARFCLSLSLSCDLGLPIRREMFGNTSSFQGWMVVVQLWSPKDPWYLVGYTSVNHWDACVNAAVVGESMALLSPSQTQMTLIVALVCFGYSLSIVLMDWHMLHQVYMKKQLSPFLKTLVWQCVSPSPGPQYLYQLW